MRHMKTHHDDDDNICLYKELPKEGPHPADWTGWYFALKHVYNRKTRMFICYIIRYHDLHDTIGVAIRGDEYESFNEWFEIYNIPWDNSEVMKMKLKCA